ncbi:MAG: putative polymerase subfamily sigma factor [Aeromicrobium sp.]|nr:putative polymerase subfamily sigma factor [Aeromicrobium sp.]
MTRATNEGRRETAGFVAFYSIQRPRAIRLAHLITGSPADAQEIAQDALAVLHQRWDTVAEPAAYLRAVVVNLSRTRQRRVIRERRAVRRLHRSPDVTDEIGSMWEHLRKLTADQRTILVLRYFEDLALSDIATLLDKPLGTVKSDIHRALAVLREMVS